MTIPGVFPEPGPTGTGGCGCGASGGGVRLIDVGGQQVGINKLKAIFQAVRQARLGDEKLERQQLLRLAQRYNYIPKNVETVYEEALWREFTKG